ncbi:hypothetical protein GCM10027417_03250 [Glutamicibacter endophyticus]
MTAPMTTTTLGAVARIRTGSRDNQDKVEQGAYPFFVRSDTVERINSYAHDGEAILVPGEGRIGDIFHYINGKFDVHQRVYMITGFSPAVSARYVYYYMLQYFGSHAMQNTVKATVDSLRMPTFTSFELRLPRSRAEQDRVVEALGDFDEQIVLLEKLITKKHAIRQGMMQQLLTGRTRLPGCTEPWKQRTLGEVARIKTGARNNQDKTVGGRYPFFVRSATVERIDSYSYDCEAILVPGEGGIGSIFHYIDGKFEVHQRVYKISDFSPDVSGRFIYHFMRQYFGAHAMENSVKATVDSLRLPTFKNFELQLPSLDEQHAIVDALDDAEAELALLQGRLKKARDTKTGMMQQLLTGRTRLPAEDTV